MADKQEQVERWCVVRRFKKDIAKADYWLSYHKNEAILIDSSSSAAQFADCNQAYDAAMAAGLETGEFVIEPI